MVNAALLALLASSREVKNVTNLKCSLSATSIVECLFRKWSLLHQFILEFQLLVCNGS